MLPDTLCDRPFSPAVAERRPLGTTGLSVAPLVLGGNVFGWTADEATSFQILDAFVSAGLNMIDTADVYSEWVPGHFGGESESIIGRWLAKSGRREEVLIATKVGMDSHSRPGGLSPRHIHESIKGSLHRLQTDHVDLYQAHIDDEKVRLEETLGAFDEVLRKGQARAIGASNYTGKRLEEAAEVARSHGLRPYGSLQPRYNLYDRAGYEDDLERACRRLGLGVITYASLASGFLSGKYRDPSDLGKSPRASRAKDKLNDRGRRILAALDSVARDRSVAQASVAIAWLLSRPTVTAPIASATSLAQLDQLIEGTRLRLAPAEIELLDHASA